MTSAISRLLAKKLLGKADEPTDEGRRAFLKGAAGAAAAGAAAGGGAGVINKAVRGAAKPVAAEAAKSLVPREARMMTKLFDMVYEGQMYLDDVFDPDEIPPAMLQLADGGTVEDDLLDTPEVSAISDAIYQNIDSNMDYGYHKMGPEYPARIIKGLAKEDPEYAMQFVRRFLEHSEPEYSNKFMKDVMEELNRGD